MTHIVLLGDSIFDNGVYVSAQPDVIKQLKAKLPNNWQATLLAVDGDTTKSVFNRIKKLPKTATHLVVSVGGNDALIQQNIVRTPVNYISDALLEMATVQDKFRRDYQDMLDIVLAYNLPTLISTIYYPNFEDQLTQRVLTAALVYFNEVILTEAIKRGLPVMDLRQIFDKPSYYANPIEPSAAGGEKMTSVMLNILKTHDFSRKAATVYYT